MLSELWFEFFGSQELCLMIFAVPVQLRVFHDPTIQSLFCLLQHHGCPVPSGIVFYNRVREEAGNI